MSFSAADFADSPAQNNSHAATAPTVAASAPISSNTSSTFSAADFTDSHNPPTTSASQDTSANTTGNDSVAQHGLLRRAWDFINSPIADLSVAGHRLLPEGVKTSDIIKAAAFERMYGEAYIPGFNDFDTKAEAHLGPAPAKVTTQDGHPYVAPPESHAFKNAVRTFIAGVGKDTSDMAAGFTSPVGIATTLAGIGPEAKAGSALAKAAPVAKALSGTAFGLKGAHDVYTAGTENTPEAWQQRLQGVAQIAGGAAVAAEPVADAASTVSNKLEAPANTVKNVAKGGQPKLQTAIRNAAQSGADVAVARPSIELTTADTHPVSIEHDAGGNVINADGRHRVLVALERGDETIPVQTKLADGTTETLNQPPLVVAEKMGLGKTIQEVRDSLAATDEQQGAVRAGGGPREPLTKTVGKTVPGAPAVKVPSTAGMRNVLQDVSNDIESRGKSIYQALDQTTDNKFTTYTDRINKINDRLDTLIPDTTEADDSAIERLEQQKSEIETSQSQLFEDLKTQGIDPDLVDEAKAHWRQAQALKDVQNALATSTKGNVAAGATEIVNPDQFVTRLEKLNRVPSKGVPSRLEQALGSKEAADALVKDAYEAVKAKQHKTAAKWAAGIAVGSGLLDWRLHNLAKAAETVATVAP
jgi:uncharacterized protein (UPF0335 family)